VNVQGDLLGFRGQELGDEPKEKLHPATSWGRDAVMHGLFGITPRSRRSSRWARSTWTWRDRISIARLKLSWALGKKGSRLGTDKIVRQAAETSRKLGDFERFCLGSGSGQNLEFLAMVCGRIKL
jgi:hypothetical protein